MAMVEKIAEKVDFEIKQNIFSKLKVLLCAFSQFFNFPI